MSVACWAGAAVHQAQARVTLQRTAHLNNELRALLQNYFCDLASIDTMLTDMLVSVVWFKKKLKGNYDIKPEPKLPLTSSHHIVTHTLFNDAAVDKEKLHF